MRAELIPARGDAPMRLPRRLYRVTFLEGYGYPFCYERRTKTRTYDNPANVAKLLAALARWPTHHRLVSIHVSDCTWSEVTPADLPDPPEDTTDDRND